jgi:hypothetical protein
MKEGMYFLVMVLLMFTLWLPGTGEAQQCTQQQLHDEFFLDATITQRNYVSCASDGNLAGPTTSDQCVLNLFNAPCTNNANCKAENVMTSAAIMETIVNSDDLEKLARSAVANDQARRVQLSWLLQVDTYNMANNVNQKKWKNVFTSADSGATNAAIEAAKLKDAPRSQSVCGRVGTLSDVSLGLRGTP